MGKATGGIVALNELSKRVLVAARASTETERAVATEVALLVDLATNPSGSLNSYRTSIDETLRRLKRAQIAAHIEPAPQ